jgi:hypothetical protein
MAKVEVTINGIAYPCRPTMGAMLRFKRETGKEITELNAESFEELCVYLYCCIASASSADKIEFNMTLMEFADSILPDDLAKWATALQANTTAVKGGKKK